MMISTYSPPPPPAAYPDWLAPEPPAPELATADTPSRPWAPAGDPQGRRAPPLPLGKRLAGTVLAVELPPPPLAPGDRKDAVPVPPVPPAPPGGFTAPLLEPPPVPPTALMLLKVVVPPVPPAVGVTPDPPPPPPPPTIRMRN